MEIGVINQHINVDLPKHVFHKPPVDLPKHITPSGSLPEHEKKQSKDHEEEKEALIIAGVGLILVGWYFT